MSVREKVGPERSTAFFDKFSFMWKGGYFEGNPLDPMGPSTYGIYGYNSMLYTVYVACIKPYTDKTKTVLEIGPGRGAWTKALVEQGCKSIYAVDAATAEHTGFWDYVGSANNVEYVVAQDCSLDGVPDGAVDYFFSFGVFCHLKPEMCEEYIESLSSKMRPGAHGFLMIADFDKHNECIDNVDRLSLKRFFDADGRKVWIPTRKTFSITWKLFEPKMNLKKVSTKGEEEKHALEARWYHWGLDRACSSIERAGFEVVERDMEVIARDPLIHFMKPQKAMLL